VEKKFHNNEAERVEIVGVVRVAPVSQSGVAQPQRIDRRVCLPHGDPGEAGLMTSHVFLKMYEGRINCF